MKKIVGILCILTIMLAPVAAYADDAGGAGEEAAQDTGEPTPLQFLKNGYIDNTNVAKEPATVNWVTGHGRKDGILEWAVDDNYAKKTSGMFLRGFSNAGFGWADILTHPFRWSKNAPLGTGTLFGLIMGPTVGILRTSSGALDLATCWVPFWHGIPMKKPVLGLHDVHNYGEVQTVEEYNHATKRYFFNGTSDEY